MRCGSYRADDWLTGTPDGGRALCRGFSAGGSWPSRRLSSETSSPAAELCCTISNGGDALGDARRRSSRAAADCQGV